jgi:hypothetical protein
MGRPRRGSHGRRLASAKVKSLSFRTSITPEMRTDD